MDTSQLLHPKGEPRKRTKARKDRREAVIKKLVRAACVVRDGRCRLNQGEFWGNNDVHVENWLRHDCVGPSEWSHFGDKKRARTRGQAPEIRHTTAGSLMLCEQMHDAYDEGRLLITALTRRGCDGRLKFRWKK